MYKYVVAVCIGTVADCLLCNALLNLNGLYMTEIYLPLAGRPKSDVLEKAGY